MKTVIWSQLSETARKETLQRPALADNQQLTNTVADIIADVRSRGDQAIKQLTLKFDGFIPATFRISEQAIISACEILGSEIKAAIEQAYENIKAFHKAQQFKPISVETTPGVLCELHSQPIEAVGLYVPGGTAPLPSTVLMLGSTAQIAGCPRKVLCTPPAGSDNNSNPTVTPEILYAAHLCGIDEIYAVGGAQAIAALAFGTESITKVDKIFGPGNSFVTEAKQQVSREAAGAAIDMPAGPSEVLVLADDTANPAFIAADLLSQAEHGADSQVVLVTTSERIANQTDQQLQAQLAKLSRNNIAEKALQNSRTVIADDIQQAAEISNQYAPEHLIVQTENPRALLPALKNAGSIFLGAYTPESAGDYASGTNHVLPTYGNTKAYSSLNLADFCKRYTVQELSREGLKNISSAITHLADAEGLDAHKNAVVIRLEGN